MPDVIVTERNELQKIIKKCLRAEAENFIPKIVRKAIEKPWMTKQELMDLTGWSSRTLQHLRDTNQIPYSKHGRKILYPRDGIMEFLEEHQIPANK